METWLSSAQLKHFILIFTLAFFRLIWKKTCCINVISETYLNTHAAAVNNNVSNDTVRTKRRCERGYLNSGKPAENYQKNL